MRTAVTTFVHSTANDTNGTSATRPSHAAASGCVTGCAWTING